MTNVLELVNRLTEKRRKKVLTKYLFQFNRENLEIRGKLQISNTKFRVKFNFTRFRGVLSF